MNIEIESISARRYSSKYGDEKAFGQPLGFKSIVIVSVREKSGLVRSAELYAGIYIPEVIPILIDEVSKNYIGLSFNRDNVFNLFSIPFVTNSGIFRAVVGAIQSCIIQLYFHKNDTSLVNGLRSELRNKSIEDNLFYYASGGSVAYSPEECRNDASKIAKYKLDGFKMRCGYQSLEEDIKRVKNVRKELNKNLEKGKKTSLMIDLIQGTLKKKFSTEELDIYINSLEKYDILWFEEPLDPDKFYLYDDYNKMYNKKVNLALGESFTSINEYILYENLINFFQLDVTHCGGFSETINVLNLFSNKKSSLKFTSHVWGSALAGLLNLSLARASDMICWFEIPLLEFEVNSHLFNNQEINYKNLSNDNIDKLLSEINLSNNQKYEFIYGSGYKI